MRLIDADELMEHVWRDKLDSRELIAKMIDNAPTVKEISTKIPIDIFEKLVSQEPKSGRWIKTIGENGITSAVRCSECGFEDNRYMLFRYCPSCGAKMKEGSDSWMTEQEIKQAIKVSTCKEFKNHLKELSEINILGTKYRLMQFKDDNSNRTALGLCDTWDKIIYIDLDWYILSEENGASGLNRMYKTIRHEIVHAFLYELGMTDEFLNERLADALSIKASQLIELWSPFLDITNI